MSTTASDTPAAIPKHLNQATNKIYFEIALFYIAMIAVLVPVALHSPPDAPTDWLWYAIAFLVVGWCQFSLTHAVHEVVHRNCGSPHREWLGAFLTVYPIGMNMSYRYVHFDHHKYFGQPGKDPEYDAYSHFPRTKLEFLMRLVRYGSGLVALKQFLFQTATNDKVNRFNELIRLLLAQAVIFSAFVWLFAWWGYFVFWVLPIMTVGKLCSTTQAFCEHGSPDDIPVYRTITGGSLRTVVLGMFKFNFHGEHHAHPAVPYTNLAETHTHLVPGEILPGGFAYAVYTNGYLGLLSEWFASVPWSAGASR